MKKLFSKTISVLLALTMILSLVGTSAFAADFTKFKVDNGEVTLDGTNPGTVTVAWVGTGDQNIYAIECNWSTKETEGTSYLTLTAITSDVVTFSGFNYVDAASGKVMWSDDTFSAPGVVSNGKALLKATYQVAANTPVGTYTVTYTSSGLAGDDFNTDTRTEVVTAKITVKGNTPAHEHAWSAAWSKDATHHWHDCTATGCDVTVNADKNGYAAHNYNQKVATKDYLKTAANCTDAAVYFYSCECGAKGTETFEYGEPLGHSWGQHVADKNLKSAADCENPAVYYVSCGRCDARDTENTFTYGEKLGHKGGEWQSNENGHWKLCERVNCGKRFNEGTHDGGKATCQAKAACTTCGAAYGEFGAHDMDTKWSSNDTQHFHKCLTKGCDYIKDAADHSGGKATCKEKAKCDVCAAEYGNLGAHTLTKTAAKAPTCLEPGNNEYYTCSVCGKVFKDAAGTTETTVAAETLAKSTTHVVESKYVTNATEHFKTCSVCGIEIKDSRAKHTFAKDEATGVETCSVCGYAIGGKVDENHKHAADKEAGLFRDENNHWYKCTDKNCTSHVGEAKHDFETVSTTKDGNKTTTVEKCKTCGYVKTTTVDNTPVNPSKPGRPSGTKTVQSGKTFDAGVGVYVGLSILSLTGSAVVIGKKRKTR